MILFMYLHPPFGSRDIHVPHYLIRSSFGVHFVGFGNRLLSEMKALAPSAPKIRISAPPERKFTTWIGGSILAALDTFKKMFVLTHANFLSFFR